MVLKLMLAIELLMYFAGALLIGLTWFSYQMPILQAQGMSECYLYMRQCLYCI